jgi:hypothetical protein
MITLYIALQTGYSGYQKYILFAGLFLRKNRTKTSNQLVKAAFICRTTFT